MKPIALSQLQQGRVLVVGDVMLDRYWYGSVDRISPEAPVPVVRVTREEERLGGSANVAYNVVSLGAPCTLLSVVGNDEASHTLERLIERTGITPCLGRDEQLKTTVKLRIIGRQQQLIRADFENAPQRELLATQTSQFNALIDQHQAVLFSDYGKGGLAHVADMIATARAVGRPVLIDPKGSDYSRYRGATVITPNRAELQDVIGRWHDEDDLQRKAQALRHELELDALLLTRSEEGMTLFQKGAVSHQPARAREVFDVSGAGDTVIAVLAVMLGAGASLSEATRIANHAAGVVVGKLGTAVVQTPELVESLDGA